MNIEIPLPKKFLFKKRFALLLSDERMDFVSWTRGKIDLVSSFPNDQVGINEFKNFLESNKKVFSKISVHVLLNIVGEDYRFELIPHLIGRYKTAFINKRTTALYRGSKFTQSVIMGREELGKRQDMTLFVGVLTEDKVAPWVNLVSRYGIEIAGVYSQALVLKRLAKKLNLSKRHVVLTTFGGGNSIRQCYFHAGQMRHSRVTKLPPSSSTNLVMRAIAAETERFQQYLIQLKTARGVRIEYHVIVPPAELGEFQQSFREIVGEKAERYFFYDGEQVAKVLGISQPLVEWGKDSSIAIDLMFSSVRLMSLAPFDVVRYYWLRLITQIGLVAASIYAFLVIGGEFVTIFGTYFNYQLENSRLEEDVARLQSRYENQVAAFGTPPSTPANMRAVSNIFTYSNYEQINPAPLLYYVSKALQKNSNLIDLNQITWNLTDNVEVDAGSPSPLSYLSGEELYQIVTLKGKFLDRQNQTLNELLGVVGQFIGGFQEHSGIEVKVISGPRELNATKALSGTASYNEQVVVASELTSLDFVIQVRWKQRNRKFIDSILSDEIETTT